jgi:hypothetical protein
LVESDPEQDEGTSAQQIAGGVVAGVMGTIIAVKVAPHVKKWWLDDALPTLRAKWSRLTRSEQDESEAEQCVSDHRPVVVPSELSEEIDGVLDDSRVRLEGLKDTVYRPSTEGVQEVEQTRSPKSPDAA